MFSVNKEQINCEFENYVDKFSPINDQQKLKLTHIKMVAKNCFDIAEIECPDYKDLAWLIGICHDIGRFEQVKKYGTFKDENSVDHAQLSNQILFKKGLLDKFFIHVKCNKTEKEQIFDIIKNAVWFHNKIEIDKSLDGLCMLMCKIIRDADKIDIMRVCAMDEPFVVYGGTKDEIQCSKISKDVFELAKFKRAIPYKLRKSLADDVICHLVFIYDINFDASLRLIKDQGYYYKMINFKFKDYLSQERFRQLCAQLPI